MATTPAPGAAPADAQPGSRRALVAGAIGNFVEWYDFTLYGASAPILAMIFFSDRDPGAALLATFATFGVAFLARPFGAVLLGNLGDRIGRRAVLAGTVLAISGGTAVIGLLPTYSAVGLVAPLLLVLIRALQGFSAGGEFGGSVAFIIEYAPAGRRGYYGSWQTATVGLGAAAGSTAVVLVSSLLSQEDLLAWGWRIPFLAALPIGLVGLYLRLRMEDTPAYRAEKAAQEEHGRTEAPIAQVFRRHWRFIALGAGVVTGGTVSTYVFQNYVPTFLNTTDGVPLRVEQLGNTLGLLVYAASCLVWGRLSDRIGRKPVVLGGAVALLVLVLPLFWLTRVGTTLAIAAGLALFGVAAAAVMGIVPVLLSDFFPTAVRMSGLSMAYTIANVLFGGTAPFVVTALVGATDVPDAAVFYCMAAVVVTLVAALRLRPSHESRGTDQGAAAPATGASS